MYTKKTFLLAIFKLILTPFGNEIYEKTEFTTICPCTKSDWDMRAKEFNCMHRHYTCILNKENKLVETCMHNYSVSANGIGCPQIGANVAASGPQLYAKLSQCNVTGCPRRDGEPFSTNQLYKYPICWIPPPARIEGYDLTKYICRKQSPEACEERNHQVMSSILETQVDNNNRLMVIAVTLYIIILSVIIFATVKTVWRRFFKQKYGNGIPSHSSSESVKLPV